MEYRINITLPNLGHSNVAEENCELILEAFQRTHPEAGPVTGADLRAGTLTVTFAVDAESAEDAFEHGSPMFNDGMAASGLPAKDTQPTRLEIELVPAEEFKQDRELQPA